jgi:hypothetical protein
MYFKKSLRPNPETGKLAGYYRLVESYRNIDDRVCHRTLLNIGFLRELTIDQLVVIQRLLSERADGQTNMFRCDDPDVLKYTEMFWEELVEKKKIDLPDEVKRKKSRLVDIETIKHKDVKEIGSEWLGLQILKQLRLPDFLLSLGWSQERVQLTLTQIISRAVYPASELQTSRWIRENSAVCEISGYSVEKITKDVLYANALSLYEIKDRLEKHLSIRTNELFDIQDKIVLFDLTNTYFEGNMTGSQFAKRGRSKEKRSDAKLIVLALVINPQGFIKYSNVFEGNTADCNTLPDIIGKLRQQTSQSAQKAIVVIDAGIATEDNLELILKKGYDYVCVSRKSLKDYQTIKDKEITKIVTRQEDILDVSFVKHPQSTDVYLKVKSPGKVLKETGMKELFESRFEQELEKIKEGLTRKHATKRQDKIHQRIGRYKQKYPSVSKYYHIEVSSNEKGMVTDINWHKDLQLYSHTLENLGVYFIRTSLDIAQEQTLWDIYNTIREVEYSFRTLKTDLDLRPVYHKTDKGSIAHLHLGLLAYWLVNTLRYQLKSTGINSCWKEIVRIGNTQKMVTTTGVNQQNTIIQVRKCSEPPDALKRIYQALQIKTQPFIKRKSVVHKPELKKNETLHYQVNPPE